jgi:hypothetical protein
MRTALPVLFLAALWDTITTVHGTLVFLDAKTPGIAISSVLVGLVTLIFMYFTFDIFGPVQSRAGGTALRGLWWIALFYKVFTSYHGNKDLIGSRIGNYGYVVLAAMTLLICSSTILTSWILFELRNKSDK